MPMTTASQRFQSKQSTVKRHINEIIRQRTKEAIELVDEGEEQKGVDSFDHFYKRGVDSKSNSSLDIYYNTHSKS